MLTSMVCRYEHFLTPWYRKWSERLGFSQADSAHRKIWEYCAITQALHERSLLAEGKRGCGFAVGTEPLAAMFASQGATVLATDLMQERSSERWLVSAQHASSLDDLYKPNIISEETFRKRVSFEFADMRDLGSSDAAEFDFIWSSCAFEHLGTIETGLHFVLRSTELLKPGGLAVHTTEFNVSSNDETISEGPDVIYRKRDLDYLAGRLRMSACGLLPVDYNAGLHEHDLKFDYPPFYQNGRMHVKILYGNYIITSILLLIQKG
jgi:hypothetical protein